MNKWPIKKGLINCDGACGLQVEHLLIMSLINEVSNPMKDLWAPLAQINVESTPGKPLPGNMKLNTHIIGNNFEV